MFFWFLHFDPFLTWFSGFVFLKLSLYFASLIFTCKTFSLPMMICVRFWFYSLWDFQLDYLSLFQVWDILLCLVCFYRPCGPVTVVLENVRQGINMLNSWRMCSDSQCPKTNVEHSLLNPFRYIIEVFVYKELKHIPSPFQTNLPWANNGWPQERGSIDKLEEKWGIFSCMIIHFW